MLAQPVEKRLDLPSRVRREGFGERHGVEARSDEGWRVGQDSHEAAETAEHLRQAREGEDRRERHDDGVTGQARANPGEDGLQGGRVQGEEHQLAPRRDGVLRRGGDGREARLETGQDVGVHVADRDPREVQAAFSQRSEEDGGDASSPDEAHGA